jgi:hypothetical protein
MIEGGIDGIGLQKAEIVVKRMGCYISTEYSGHPRRHPFRDRYFKRQPSIVSMKVQPRA